MKYKIQLPLIIGCVSAFSMFIGMRLQESLERDGYIQKDETHKRQDLKAIYEAAGHITAKYYPEALDLEYTDEVIGTMIDNLDPYSHYFRSDQDKLYDDYMKGIYNGIGIEFIALGDTIYHYDIVVDSPADKAGLVRGERLIAVNNISFTGEAARMDSLITFLNHQDSMISIRVEDLAGEKIRQVKLMPADVSLPLVEDYIIDMDGRDISYVRIHRFYKTVYQDVMSALEQHGDPQGKRPDYLIIDVRDNPGGVVEETVKIVNQLFANQEVLLLNTRSRNSRSQTYKTNGRTFWDFERVVVICNEQSASASEILAGVLQDHDKAVIVGSHTFGKGLIQQNYDLSNDASINLSIGEYILPTGRSIYRNNNDSLYYSLSSGRLLPQSEKGIGPDITISTCKISEGDLLKSKQEAIARGWWSAQSIHESFDIEALGALDIAEACEGIYSSSLRWTLIRKSLKLGDVIDVSYTDEHISRSCDLIVSDRYDMILEGAALTDE